MGKISDFLALLFSVTILSAQYQPNPNPSSNPTTPGGSDGAVQYNSSGSFGGSSWMSYASVSNVNTFTLQGGSSNGNPNALLMFKKLERDGNLRLSQ